MIDLRIRIHAALDQNRNWLTKPTINKMVNNQTLGRKYTGETIGRELRRLAQEEIILKQKNGKYVQYKRRNTT